MRGASEARVERRGNIENRALEHLAIAFEAASDRDTDDPVRRFLGGLGDPLGGRMHGSRCGTGSNGRIRRTAEVPRTAKTE